MPRFTGRIPDPRPSRAHPEHRKLRKELEKEHGYGWVPPVILALLGVTLAFDVTKDVEKHEQRHKQAEEEEEGKRKRRRREKDQHSGSRRHRRRDSEDEERGNDDDDDAEDDYNSRDRRRTRSRRDRSRRGEQRQRWSVPDDIDIRNDYEGLGGGREDGMERAESLEPGEVVDYDKLDGGLDKADLLEKGEGGMDDGGRYEGRPHPSIAYDEFDDERRQYRRRRYEEPDYEYLDYRRGRQALDDRRSGRPRPRRRSSDW